MMPAAQLAQTIDDAVGRHPVARSAVVHRPADDAGGAEGEEVGNRAVSRHAAFGDMADDGINLVEVRRRRKIFSLSHFDKFGLSRWLSTEIRRVEKLMIFPESHNFVDYQRFRQNKPPRKFLDFLFFLENLNLPSPAFWRRPCLRTCVFSKANFKRRKVF